MPASSRHIFGFRVTGDSNGMEELRHKDEFVSRALFTQAAEIGTVVFRGRKDEPYTLTRLPDYTFAVSRGEGISNTHL